MSSPGGAWQCWHASCCCAARGGRARSRTTRQKGPGPRAGARAPQAAALAWHVPKAWGRLQGRRGRRVALTQRRAAALQEASLPWLQKVRCTIVRWCSAAHLSRCKVLRGQQVVCEHLVCPLGSQWPCELQGLKRRVREERCLCCEARHFVCADTCCSRRDTKHAKHATAYCTLCTDCSSLR